MRSLHVPRRPSIVTNGLGCVVVAGFFASNYFFNHIPPGPTLRDLPFVYIVGVYLTFGVAPAAAILEHVSEGRPAASGWLGLGLTARDLSAGIAALTLGCVLAYFPIGAKVGATGGFEGAARLFSILLVASTAETLVFLGIAANLLHLAIHNRWSAAPSWVPGSVAAAASSLLFGFFHFSYAPPFDTLENALLLTVVWLGVSAVFLATRSLLAAILFNNTMALIGFVQRDLDLPGTFASGMTWAGVAVALFAGTYWLAARHRVR